ncbi:MAG: SDR family NAD(P)-dependent oxidoreductase [Pseudomonadota bacterium]
MRALVTGAASGLGKSLTLKLADSGFEVVALDRDREGLEQIKSDKIRILSCELADTEALATRLDEFAEAGPFDQVILNAGISATGKFEKIPSEVHQKLLAVNAVAPMILASGLAARNAFSPSASLIFIASLACQTGYPGAASYAASKDAVAVYAKSIDKPFGKQGISVMTVFPGPIRTGHAAFHAPPGASEEKRMHPDELARRILKAAGSRSKRYYPGVAAKLSALAGRIAPRTTTGLMRKVLFEKLPEEKW